MIKSQKIKNLIKALSFLLILIAVFSYASLVFHPKSNAEGAGMDDQRAVSILAEEKNTLDVVAVGNSDLYSGVLPMELYEKYGYTTYVCGQSKQSMPQAYDMLKKALSIRIQSLLSSKPIPYFTVKTVFIKWLNRSLISTFRYLSIMKDGNSLNFPISSQR